MVLPDAAHTLGPPASRLSLSEPCQAVAAAAGCTVPRRGKCRGCVEKLSGKHAALSVVKGSESPAFVIATRPHAFQTVSENEAAARQTRPHALEFASRKLARRSPCQRAASSVKGPGSGREAWSCAGATRCSAAFDPHARLRRCRRCQRRCRKRCRKRNPRWCARSCLCISCKSTTIKE